MIYYIIILYETANVLSNIKICELANVISNTIMSPESESNMISNITKLFFYHNLSKQTIETSNIIT